MEKCPTSEEIKKDLDYMLDYGNHKSGTSPEGESIIEKAYVKEVQKK